MKIMIIIYVSHTHKKIIYWGYRYIPMIKNYTELMLIFTYYILFFKFSQCDKIYILYIELFYIYIYKTSTI